MFMKTFEERYTAWVDGTLEEPELGAFERELPDVTAAKADREDLLRLGKTLRRLGKAPVLNNADFFSHQLLERIASEERVARPVARRSSSLFSLPQMAWAGACCLLLAFGLYYALIPPRPGAAGFASVSSVGSGKPLPISAAHPDPTPTADAEPTIYDASIIEATPQEPGISATSVYSKAENMTVLWLDGLDYLPASYELQ